MSPPSTCAVSDTATRATLPALGDRGFHLHRLDRRDGLPGADHVPLGHADRDDPGEGCRDVAGVVEISFLGGRHRPGDGRTSTVFWLQSDREVVATAKPVSPMRLAAAACAGFRGAQLILPILDLNLAKMLTRRSCGV